MSERLPGDFYPASIQQALGAVVILWSNLEATAGEALLNLGYLVDFDSARFMLTSLDLRNRVASLKAVCFIEMREVDYAVASRWLNFIDNDLRTHRNRLIHDTWEADDFEMLLRDNSVTRRTLKASVVKEPSTGSLRIKTEDNYVVTADHLIDFCRDLDDARQVLEAIRWYGKDGYTRHVPEIASRYKSSLGLQ